MVETTETRYVIHKYPEEHYVTFFDRETGSFARVEEKGFPEPFWACKGPELMDISITDWCDRECAICYKNANRSGKHMRLTDYEEILAQAQEMNVLQIALGGGNPNQHPDFVEILRLTRKKYGIVPSYTTNGRGLNSKILIASRDYCGAVAVSAYEPYNEMAEALRLLRRHDITANVHFVLTSHSVDTAIQWLERPPSILKSVNALVFLNYKPVGNHKSKHLLLRNSGRIKEFYRLAVNGGREFNVGFDSCLVSGLAKFTETDPVMYESCDSGRFSMYISRDLRMYPCSFMEDKYEGDRMSAHNIQDTWRNSRLFKSIRNRSYARICLGCSKFEVCRGGVRCFPRSERLRSRRWRVRVIDCRYRPLDYTEDNYRPGPKGQDEGEYYIHEGWTDLQVRRFRRCVRRQNIAVLLDLPNGRYIDGCESRKVAV